MCFSDNELLQSIPCALRHTYSQLGTEANQTAGYLFVLELWSAVIQQMALVQFLATGVTGWPPAAVPAGACHHADLTYSLQKPAANRRSKVPVSDSTITEYLTFRLHRLLCPRWKLENWNSNTLTQVKTVILYCCTKIPPII